MTTITHHHLSAEQVNDKHGPAIMLTQQGEYSEPSTVLVHPWQLRAVCEQFGIIASDPQAAKTIASLQRRMLVLHKRITHLADFLATCSDRKHADLDYEVDYAGATADIANEFVADFAGDADVAAVQPLKPEADQPAATAAPEAATKDLFI